MAEEVALPERFKAVLGAPHGMDYHLVDIRLQSGRTFFALPVMHGAVIVGATTRGKEVPLGFTASEIAEVRRASFGIKSLFYRW